MRSQSGSVRKLLLRGGLKGRLLSATALALSGCVGWMLMGGHYYAVARNQAETSANEQAALLAGLFGGGETRPEPLPYLRPWPRDMAGPRLLRVTAPGEPVADLGVQWDDVARHHYSLDQAWDADQSLLMLDRGTPGRLFLDGQTFEPRFIRQRPGESRWHPQLPGLQILLNGQTLGLWNVRTDQITPVETFPSYKSLALGPNKGNPSHDGRMIALLGKDQRGRQVVFAYDLVARRKYPDLDLNGKDIAYVTISPSGNYIVVVGRLWPDEQSKGDQTEILDLFGGRVGPAWKEYGRPSHFDLGFDALGEEVAVGISKSSPEAWQIIKRRLRDGAVVPLSAPGAGTHVSLRAIDRPGWAYVTFGDGEDREGWLPYHREIVAIKLDGSGQAVEIAPTFSTGRPYVAEAHAVPSPDGCAIIFASDWGIRGGDVGAYVARSPWCSSPAGSNKGA
jgi:hypothetical protein